MDLLLFDMDGVLIDVSRSYQKVIERTIQLYLQTCFGLSASDEKLIGEKDVSLFKSVKGFNSDWDVTSALLLYLLSLSPLPPDQRRKKPSSMEDLVSYLKRASSPFFLGKKHLFKRKNLPDFLKKVELRGGGLMGVHQVLEGGWEGWVYGSGDLLNENLIKRMFQEIYLGEKFTPCYHHPRLFYRGKGLYLEERMIISRKILASLQKRFRLGIASGRTRFEADLALRRFRLAPYFESVVTLDECEEEEERVFRTQRKRIRFSKPHPFSILKAIQKIGLPHPKCGYIGDTVDDMLAAKAAKKEIEISAIGFVGQGIGKSKTIRESLLRAGADLIINRPEELLEVTSAGPRILGSRLGG